MVHIELTAAGNRLALRLLDAHSRTAAPCSHGFRLQTAKPSCGSLSRLSARGAAPTRPREVVAFVAELLARLPAGSSLSMG
jgi:hypothetical protein